MSDTVLLTGISGFLGGHVALALLNAGYTVRGSVRNLDKAGKVRQTLENAGASTDRLDFVALDLTRDEGWAEAMEGCRYLLHTASPFVIQMPQDKNELLRPAIEGTERAVNAALASDIERIVLTSSMAAIAYGHDPERAAPFTAADWTDLDGRDVNAYVESKTRAERRAWDLMKAAGREDDLVTINPSAILGPLLDDDPGTSAAIIQRLLNGTVPAAPRIPFVLVDVRDVAAAHVAAITGEVGGKRIPVGERPVFMFEIAQLLRKTHPGYAGKLPRFEMPDWAVRIYALFDKDMRGILGELGVRKSLDSSTVEALLGRRLIPADEAAAATAESLIAQKLV